MTRWACALFVLAAYVAGRGDWRAALGTAAVWASVRLGVALTARRTARTRPRREPRMIDPTDWRGPC